MKSINVKITDKNFLHRKMASQFQAIAGKYMCDVDVIVNTDKANAKSLINLMSVLAKIKIPSTITVSVSNWAPDEDKAMKEIEKFFSTMNK